MAFDMVRMGAMALAFVAGLTAGCSTDFEDPTLVIDLRVLAISADPPELLVPPDPDLIDEDALVPIRLCALVADPGASRQLTYEMAACAPTNDKRCTEPDEPVLIMPTDAPRVDDPDEAGVPVEMCGTLAPSPLLFDVIEQAVENDPLGGFSSIAVQVELFVKPSGGADEDGIFAAKRAFFGAQLPEERTPNTNPAMAELLLGREGDDEPTEPVALTRCAADDAQPFEVASDERVELLPVEVEGTREDYLLPTFDGGARMFTEVMTYAWYATHGEWGSGVTGGPPDGFGNEPKLETAWRAPEVDEVTDVPLWIVQRDERGGLTWYEACARVSPP